MQAISVRSLDCLCIYGQASTSLLWGNVLVFLHSKACLIFKRPLELEVSNNHGELLLALLPPVSVVKVFLAVMVNKHRFGVFACFFLWGIYFLVGWFV